MINCKKSIITACFVLMLPFALWAEAPVIDDSENFAMIDRQEEYDAPLVNPKYDEPQIENAELDGSQNDNYATDTSQPYDEPALVKDDQKNIHDSAKLIDKIQQLQKEIQELRGQLEVQAHDLKLLQQQQVAFYKDLDSRLSNSSTSAKTIQNDKPATDVSLGSNSPVTLKAASPQIKAGPSTGPSNSKPQPVIAVSRANPADEQISYLAAYELVKNKRYDEAIKSMQTFVQKYPRGGYTANAEYWLGELYLVKKDYPKAIEHFEIVLQQYPSSSKAAASLLKSGYAYAEKGDTQEAKKRFQQVVKTYPDTPTAQLASSKLEAINAL
ncbi:TPA: tol-pal system protein YbgF [Legionella pneumophila]|uniref:tol-pal system protein YbgF n=1 Tax=Legionella pneumophila TaxID=446 RepID=UPI00078839FB|nr:tol-pal system protein YbgF [Legionella pneumophila]MDW8877650.1 tol-pal system protein YbgF [Legionella pneumophila subsp. fraseri]MDW8960689.1 tol-pal system protein YbgF [Legionella pneumophila subsp. fraseri]MDW9035288.1 tol-pal system protein YbgF [Legionella pneumophila subsp. fraseri]MDW9038349.1 tol-pal system protein YbgF [Legionella pneumophila subsp. fraseri]MDW9041410.1 tol-pal system protein YbgF [Legionella pneumophila subsp. fraseri]